MSSEKRKYAALLSYQGTAYCGWQKQSGSAASGGPSVQETFEKTLLRITSEEKISAVGSGRTDSGVHAAGQVVHFVLQKKAWDTGILRKALNSLLPQDIRALAVQEVPIEFHAQRSAEKKQYSYFFQQGPAAPAHLKPYSWWIQRRLDLPAMRQALSYLVGEHDFKPFQASGSAPMRTTVRTILEADLIEQPAQWPSFTPIDGGEAVTLVRMRLVGTGFLKQMVRGIAGTLVQVGEGKRTAESVREILETGDRLKVGPTAPPRALWLERVWYPGLDWRVKID